MPWRSKEIYIISFEVASSTMSCLFLNFVTQFISSPFYTFIKNNDFFPSHSPWGLRQCPVRPYDAINSFIVSSATPSLKITTTPDGLCSICFLRKQELKKEYQELDLYTTGSIPHYQNKTLCMLQYFQMERVY